MSESDRPQIGTVFWRDLTVENAEEVRNFYCEVVGWKSAPHDMGKYHDFDMNDPISGDTLAGICHARGENAAIPPQWLMYIIVEDAGESARRCVELGGKVIDGPRQMGGSNFCVIEDPAGAVAALISQ